jgi:hypothetical protein
MEALLEQLHELLTQERGPRGAVVR